MVYYTEPSVKSPLETVWRKGLVLAKNIWQVIVYQRLSLACRRRAKAEKPYSAVLILMKR